MPANATDPTVPAGVDVTRASVARVYDYLLGGKDHYEIDRDVARKMQGAMPEVADGARENRAFLIRVCRFLARETGVTQYLDCGSGLPTAENTHQVVQRITPEAKVVYVDHDPVVIAHGRALLEENDRTRFVDADIFEPATVVGHPETRKHLDFAKPIALLMLATLHHHQGDRGRPAQIMREYIDALPSGSYVAISHLYNPRSGDARSEQAEALEEALRRTSLGGGTARTHQEIEQLFAGLEMVPPGLVILPDWWPDGPRITSLTVGQRIVAGGVGRKP